MINLESRIDILAATTMFYQMEVVDAIKVEDMFKKSHEKWEDDWSYFTKEYRTKLANAIFDYTVMAVAGEMRHANRCSDIRTDFDYNDTSRNTAYKNVAVYDPWSLLKTAATVFGPDVDWNGGYGGEKWAAIAEAALTRKTYNDVVWIDHIVDLSHNNASYFDKGAIFSLCDSHNYLRFLTYKRKNTDDMKLLTLPMSIKLKGLLDRAVVLGIIPTIPERKEPFKIDGIDIFRASKENFGEASFNIMGYTPIEWGSKRVNITETDARRGYRDDDDDDDNGDDDDNDDDDNSYTLSSATVDNYHPDFKAGDMVIVREGAKSFVEVGVMKRLRDVPGKIGGRLNKLVQVFYDAANSWYWEAYILIPAPDITPDVSHMKDRFVKIKDDLANIDTLNGMYITDEMKKYAGKYIRLTTDNISLIKEGDFPERYCADVTGSSCFWSPCCFDVIGMLPQK